MKKENISKIYLIKQLIFNIILYIYIYLIYLTYINYYKYN
jgi:hypothetical protein